MKEWFRNSTIILCQGRIIILLDLDCGRTSITAIKPSCSSTLNAGQGTGERQSVWKHGR